MKIGTILRVGLAALVLTAASAAPIQNNREVTTKPKITITAPRAKALASQPAGSGYQIDFNWQYVANLPVCTSTLVACYDGFQMTDVTTGTLIGGVGTTLPIGPTALSFNWAPTGGVPYGTQVFSLVAHGYDENGNPVVSTPVTCTVTIPVTTLNGPTGLVGVKQ
jgi:hypothetical protein